jgi:hypothetical protein
MSYALMLLSLNNRPKYTRMAIEFLSQSSQLRLVSKLLTNVYR